MGSPARGSIQVEESRTLTANSKGEASPAAVLEVELLDTSCRRTCRDVTKRPSLAGCCVGERQGTYGIVPGGSAYTAAYLRLVTDGSGPSRQLVPAVTLPAEGPPPGDGDGDLDLKVERNPLLL